MLTITHTHEAGTLIEGTSRGDGTADILKANRWRWGRSISAWYVPNSRDHRPNHPTIRRTADALTAAGFEVTTELDESVRSTAEVEAGKIARQADRVAALEQKVDRKQAAADAAWQRHEADAARLPEGGEPVKIGHHSEPRHRRALDRAHASMGASVQADHDANEVARRADEASHTTGARYSVVTVANRIQKLGADIRRAERSIEADYYHPERGYEPATQERKDARAVAIAPRLTELRDQLTYWESVRAEQIADGTATNYSRDTIKPGDTVKVGGYWYRVVRANAKTVSVDTGHSWTQTTPYAKITAHRPAGG
ncbi:DUF3560 domain-containing protein [Schumannella soli]|uniref:DUF3560 domain-containing protein n=1 Tax=Schumannella soli TaxID=2590779 RepID=A0A506XYQ3_9MICO|nr:DUF3560 domain-containing protein [Schumannella soli]TPW78064.1 DUF3560 domain-containing protein [Schumannella soli]